MKDNTILIFVLGIMIMYSLYDLKQDRINEAHRVDLTNDNIKKDKTIQELKKYPLICIRLNEITDKYLSSRTEKRKDRELMNLITK